MRANLGDSSLNGRRLSVYGLLMSLMTACFLFSTPPSLGSSAISRFCANSGSL